MKYVDIIEECNYNSEFELDVMFQLIFLLVKILFSSYEMSGIVHWWCIMHVQARNEPTCIVNLLDDFNFFL